MSRTSMQKLTNSRNLTRGVLIWSGWAMKSRSKRMNWRKVSRVAHDWTTEWRKCASGFNVVFSFSTLASNCREKSTSSGRRCLPGGTDLTRRWKADTECEYEKSAAEFIETWMKGLGQISGSAEQCEGRKLDMMFRWDRTHITKASGFERTRDFSRWNYSSHISYVLQLKLWGMQIRSRLASAPGR